MELRFARYVGTGEISSRDPSKGSQGSREEGERTQTIVMHFLFQTNKIN